MFSSSNEPGRQADRRRVGWPVRLVLLVLLVLLTAAGPAVPRADRNPGPDPAAGSDPGSALGTALGTGSGSDAEPGEEATYRILITGNSGLTENELLKAGQDELDLLGKSDMAINALLDDAAFEMTTAYRRAGYPSATVDYGFERLGPLHEITFAVAEGVRCFIRRIELRGGDAFSEEQLLAFFGNGKGAVVGQPAKPFVETEVNTAVDELRSFYYGQGYQDAVIGRPELQFSEDRAEVVIVIEIREGSQYRIRNLEFSGDLPEEAMEQLHDLAAEMAGALYYARQRLLVRSLVLEIYGNLGYADAEIEVNEKEGQEMGDVILAVTINSGPRVMVGDIVLPENIKTRPAYILSRLHLRAGEPFSLKGQRESFRELYGTGLFSRVDLNLGQGETPEERPLEVVLVEQPSRELSFQAGWGSYEQLRLGIGVQEKNFQGKGRRLRAEGLVSMKSEKLEVGLTDPRFTGRDILADIPVYYRRREEPGFTIQEIGSSVNVTKSLMEGLVSTLRYQYRFTDIFETDPLLLTGAELPETNYNVASLRLQFTLDRRDDMIFPNEGYRGYFSVESADTLLGSEINFLRLTAGWRRYYPWRDRHVIGLRYETGMILPMRDQVNLPQAEKFFNGGENTVRSFKQDGLGPRSPEGDPVGGLAYNVLSLELRRRFGKNMAVSFFADAGNIAPNQGALETGGQPVNDRTVLIDRAMDDYFNDFRGGIGMGFLYLLPVGPARIDLAVNPAPDKDRNEETYVFHFSFGMAF